jgi:hypothetical protein
MHYPSFIPDPPTIAQCPCSATESISSTTQNPLVIGQNDTTNSDKRIFGNDGNTAMSLCDLLYCRCSSGALTLTKFCGFFLSIAVASLAALTNAFLRSPPIFGRFGSVLMMLGTCNDVARGPWSRGTARSTSREMARHGLRRGSRWEPPNGAENR